LKKLLQGDVKFLISQCDIRHLYSATPKDEEVITKAKEFERRRCGHHELDEPLSSLECITECVDPKGNMTNKFRYVVASQDPKVRAHLRRIPGVPLVYISKSVVILEPMAAESQTYRDTEEKAKFKAGIKGARGAHAGQKRKRDEEDGTEEKGIDSIEGSTAGTRPQKTKKQKGPKGPNPLSVKKSKKKSTLSSVADAPTPAHDQPPVAENSIAEDADASKGKRKRKHRPKGEGRANFEVEDETNVP
jgi:U3 small nucleolar RNA-associated protein 23